MNVLVTGAAGFVGPHLARALRDAGHVPWGTGLEAEAPVDVARWAQWDLASGPDGGKTPLAWQPDAIVHLAGQASAARSFEDPGGTFAANAFGTLALLEAARTAGFAGRVLLVSSSEVYGRIADGVPVREDAKVAPVSPYGASKAAAEAIGAAYVSGYGMHVVIARAFSHTGPGQGPSFALASWARQIAGHEARAARGEPGPYRIEVGNLEPVRDYSDVRDVVRAYLLLLERGEAGSAYNVASGKGVALRQALAALAKAAKVEIEVVESGALLRPVDLKYLVGDASRLRALGWSPRHDIAETLKDLLDGARRDQVLAVRGGS